MFGSGILDVAVGLVLAFLSVSLIASAVREIIEMLLKSRAMDLERGVRELLSDPAVTQKVFDHPLIKSLYGGVYSLANLKPARGFSEGQVQVNRCRWARAGLCRLIFRRTSSPWR